MVTRGVRAGAVRGRVPGLQFVLSNEASRVQPADKQTFILHFLNLRLKVDLILSGKSGLVLHEQK